MAGIAIRLPVVSVLVVWMWLAPVLITVKWSAGNSATIQRPPEPLLRVVSVAVDVRVGHSWPRG